VESHKVLNETQKVLKTLKVEEKKKSRKDKLKTNNMLDLKIHQIAGSGSICL
jgi:hypothetical protein